MLLPHYCTPIVSLCDSQTPDQIPPHSSPIWCTSQSVANIMHVCKYIIICILYIISIYIHTQVSLQNLQQSSTFTIEASIIQSLNIQILKLQALHLEHLEMKRGSLTFFKVKFWSVKPWIPWMSSIEMPRNAGKKCKFGIFKPCSQAFFTSVNAHLYQVVPPEGSELRLPPCGLTLGTPRNLGVEVWAIGP